MMSLFKKKTIVREYLHIHFYFFYIFYPLPVIVDFIGAFYFNLGNLRPQFRSVINMIQLVALCPVPHINTYGMNKTLQPFMRDISLLESVSSFQDFKSSLLGKTQ